MNPLQPAPFNPAHAFLDIYEQHIEEASFLWMVRSITVNQPHYKQQEIAELEQRIQAHLNGLMTSPELGWSVCEEALSTATPGELFTAAVTAFTTGDVKKIKQVVDAGLQNDKTFNGLVSALGWLTPELATPWLDKFLLSNELDHKHLGLAACSVRRHDAGDYLAHILARADCLQHKKLHARALRLIGELRRQDLMPALKRAMPSDDPDIAFWANWSAILLGDNSAVNKLDRYLLNGGKHQQRALQIAFRVLPIENARQWIAVMAEEEKLGRAVIQATAALSDPHAVNWLIQKMAEPATARIAGEAFTLITGIDLKQNGLINPHPPVLESGPNDDLQDENVAMDEDDNLPWPDAVKVAQLWQQQGRNFIVGQRYFMGQAITAPWLLKQLQQAKQRQRDAAALELALSDPTQHFYNTQGKVATA